jgi:hypothetical protein
MMMSMLSAGGIEALTDNLRTADLDNPKGYYEFEKVKELGKDSAWVKDARGKAVKIISALLKHLPQDYRYKLIFMRREMAEVLASQRQMLIRRGEPVDTISDEKMSEMFRKHLKEIESWLARQPNIEVCFVEYNKVIANPVATAHAINDFLGGRLNTEGMVSVVDENLHRQRAK